MNGPVDGFLLDHFQMQDIITVAPDRQTAKGRFRGLLMGGSHESREYKPAGLPLQFYEAGLYENDYVREGGVWKIKRLDYMMQWQADYEKGWSKTVAHLQPATKFIRRIRWDRTCCCRRRRCAGPGRIARMCRCTSRTRASARFLPDRPEPIRRRVARVRRAMASGSGDMGVPLGRLPGSHPTVEFGENLLQGAAFIGRQCAE